VYTCSTILRYLTLPEPRLFLSLLLHFTQKQDMMMTMGWLFVGRRKKSEGVEVCEGNWHRQKDGGRQTNGWWGEVGVEKRENMFGVV
jgi:hypothetical protein